MNCSKVDLLLGDYLEGGLPPEQAAAVRAHLDACPACRGAAEGEARLIHQLQREANWRRRGLSSGAAARVQEQVYRRMRRALIMQRVTQSTGRVVALAVLALAVGLVVLWQRGSLEEAAGRKVGDRDGVTVITFACQDFQRDRYEKLVKDFEAANPDIRVQFISADEASGQQRQGNMVTSDGREFERLAAAADTFVWWASLRPDDWSFLLDLGSFVADPSFPVDDFYPGTLDHFRWQGGIYGLPAEVLPTLILYDKEMFDEAGVPYPHIGWTWDDFMEAAAQLTEREGNTVKRYGFVDAHFYGTVRAMLHQYGVPLWDDRTDPPQPLFDTPEVTDVLRRYTDMALRYEIMPVPEIGSNVMAFNLVGERKVAMWTDFASGLVHTPSPTSPKAAPFPEAVDAANPRSMYGFFTSAGTAYPEAAWRWLSYLSANYQPLLEGTLPGRRSASERLRWWRRLDEETRAVLEYALAHPPAPDSPLNRPLLRAVRAVFEDGVSAEEALATAQAQALEMQASIAEATPAAPRPVASPQPTPGEGQTVITFAPAPGADLSLYRKLAASFQESHPDVGVEVVPGPVNLAEPSTVSDCFAGTFPVHIPEIRQNIRSLQPLLDADASFDLADYYPQFLEPLQQDGELWGLPYEGDALMIYTNLERFAGAGVAPPGPGWSFEDFLDAAVALSSDDQYGFTTREGAYGDLLFVLERLGAGLLDDSHEPPTPTFDDPTVVAALGQYADLSRGEALSPATPSTQSGWPDAVTMGGHPAGVQTGQVAMWADYIKHHAFASALPFETGVAPLPVPGGAEGPLGTQASTEYNVNAYYVSINAAAPQACWEWLTFLSGQPEAVRLLPARRSVAASPQWQERVGEAALPAYQATLEYADTPLFRLRWEIPWLGYAYPWLDEAFQAAVGGEDAERALGEAQAKAEAFLACLEATESFFDRDRLRACARQVDPDYPLADATNKEID